jgi:hypothetical protein
MAMRRGLRVLFLSLGVLAIVGPTASAVPGGAPPNFNIFATGPVGFGCAYGGVFPLGCTGFAFAITGDAPAYGTHIGDDARFTTTEIATPIFPTFQNNSIDGNAFVTASNGDKLCIHYSGVSPAPNPDTSGVGHLNDNLTFTIGNYAGCTSTGHFADATGFGQLTATGNVYYDARPTIVASELRGTIYMHPH